MTDCNRHHLRPRSRFKKGTSKTVKDHQNIVVLDRRFHDSLHKVFSNLTKKESMVFLDVVLNHGQHYDSRRLHSLREHIKRANITDVVLEYEMDKEKMP